MNTLPESGRLSAHVLIDAVSVYDFESSSIVNEIVLNAALERLAEVEGAVTASVTPDDTVAVNISNLVGGTLVSMEWLVESLAAARRVDRASVVVELREFLDAES